MPELAAELAEDVVPKDCASVLAAVGPARLPNWLEDGLGSELAAETNLPKDENHVFSTDLLDLARSHWLERPAGEFGILQAHDQHSAEVS